VPKISGSRLEELYRIFGPLIYARCRRALDDEALAASATEQVFVRVLPRLDHDEPRTAVEALAAACDELGGDSGPLG
jgi:hypothetical protein